MTGLPGISLLDRADLPIEELAALARREGQRRRDAYQAHGWFARRFASVARALAVAAAMPEGGEFWEGYLGGADLSGVSVLDPFVGGGVMALEAARLGADVYSSDVEPVACAISDFQGRLHLVPDLGKELADLRAEVGAEVAPFYACADREGRAETLLHAFFVQQADCACCGLRFDAHPRYRIAWNDRDGIQTVACRSCGDVGTAGRREPFLCGCGVSTDGDGGNAAGGTATCPGCGHSEKLIALARRTGRPRFRLFAVETLPAGPERRVPVRQRRIRAASPVDLASYDAAAARLRSESAADPDFVARCEIPRSGRFDRRLLHYGYARYEELFNPRQLLHLGLLARALRQKDGAAGEALRVAFSDHLATNNMMCSYAGGWGRLSPLFAIRAYRHIGRPVEINPWLSSNGRGTFPNAVRSVSRAAASLANPSEPGPDGIPRPLTPVDRGAWSVRRQDARMPGAFPEDSVDLVLTDPPYFDYVAYSELGHFYAPWLDKFGMLATSAASGFPAGQIAPLRDRNAERSFETAMAQAFSSVARAMRQDARLAFTYQNLDGKGWRALGNALSAGGLVPYAALPMYGDAASSLHKTANSISWDCVIVACKGTPPVPPAFADGSGFALHWSGRLRRSGFDLTPGDLKNLESAGSLVFGP